MKTAKWMLALGLVALSSMAVAQTIGASGLKAQVPFDFMAGNKSIPAGECVVQRSGNDPSILLIRNREAKASMLSMSSQSEARSDSADTVLVFDRYGDRYFLAAIRVAGSNVTYHLPQSKAEAELRAQNVPATQTTLLASLN